MITKCVLDLDGVIADFHSGLARLRGFDPSIFERGNWKEPGTYDIRQNTPIKEEGFWDGVDYDFWRSLDKTREADQLVDLIINRFSLENICIITMCPTMFDYPLYRIGPYCAGKIQWLLDHFPRLMEHGHILIGTSKKFCASPDTVLIDDADSNIKEFRQSGGKAIVFPRVWNAGFFMCHEGGPMSWITNELGNLK